MTLFPVCVYASTWLVLTIPLKPPVHTNVKILRAFHKLKKATPCPSWCTSLMGVAQRFWPGHLIRHNGSHLEILDTHIHNVKTKMGCNKSLYKGSVLPKNCACSVSSFKCVFICLDNILLSGKPF